MYETVKDQGEKLDNHEERITLLEETDRKHEERLQVVESNYTKLENTILKSSQAQQEFFRDTMNKQWELINARDISKDAERQRGHELRKTNVEKGWEFAGKLTVAGGVIYLALDKFFL
ncbi:hypothetical protein [Psychrobacillus sp. FSL K6-1267]|uniref:hypothetical protein n=1 Tax=Psychrobacillus sp. FSL K6-1267 TaxID=2921543 RepID=UPI0030F9FEBB